MSALETGGDPAEIEREISHTRERVEDTLEALKDRLSPRKIVDRTVASARETARHTAQDVQQHMRRHPLPWILGAVGAGLVLLVDASLPSSRDHKAHIGGLGVRRVGPVRRFGNTLADHPALLMGMGATVGLLAGASLPAPGPTERLWARRVRDEVIQRGGIALRLTTMALRALQSARG
jgi:ElaB/YqjD/DUF883 family membrane-anchored ribosome-binding protein